MKCSLLPITLLTLSSSFMMHADGLIHDFVETHPEASLECIGSFLHDHEQDEQLSNRINFVVKLRKRQMTSQEDWDKIINECTTLLQTCQENEKNMPEMQGWLELFGSPFKEILPVCGDQTGVLGYLKAKIGKSKGQPRLKIQLTIKKNEQHDESAWKTVQQILATFIDKCNEAAYSEQPGTALAQQGGIMAWFDTAYPIDKTMQLKIGLDADKLYVGFSDIRA